MEAIDRNIFTIFMSCLGALFIVFGVLYKLFPPKKISWYYGVGLLAARRSLDTWQETHRFVPKPMMVTGVLLIVIGLLPFVVDAGHFFTLSTANGVLILSTLCMTLLVKRHLNRLFDKQGQRINPGNNN